MKELAIRQEPADQGADKTSPSYRDRRTYQVDLSSLLNNQAVTVWGEAPELPSVSGHLVPLCYEILEAGNGRWYAVTASATGVVCYTGQYTNFERIDHHVIEILERYLGEQLQVQDLTAGPDHQYTS